MAEVSKDKKPIGVKCENQFMSESTDLKFNRFEFQLISDSNDLTFNLFQIELI